MLPNQYITTPTTTLGALAFSLFLFLQNLSPVGSAGSLKIVSSNFHIDYQAVKLSNNWLKICSQNLLAKYAEIICSEINRTENRTDQTSSNLLLEEGRLAASKQIRYGATDNNTLRELSRNRSVLQGRYFTGLLSVQ